MLHQNNGKGKGKGKGNGNDKGKGHLGVGADADIAVYDLDEKTGRAELERRLGCCEWLLKSGEVVVRAGRLCKSAGSAKKRSFFFVPKTKARETERDRESQRETERVREKPRESQRKKETETVRRICNRRSFRAEHLKVFTAFIFLFFCFLK
ncbi:MAG: hypothetical protein C4B55_02790 [Candidatus Methanophagaceae archaeon]|nr:MAG: hypothetical protein C4B55_02790 [Methanophagales archaeon]